MEEDGAVTVETVSMVTEQLLFSSSIVLQRWVDQWDQCCCSSAGSVNLIKNNSREWSPHSLQTINTVYLHLITTCLIISLPGISPSMDKTSKEEKSIYSHPDVVQKSVHILHNGLFMNIYIYIYAVYIYCIHIPWWWFGKQSSSAWQFNSRPDY